MIGPLLPRYSIALVATLCTYLAYATLIAPRIVGEATVVPAEAPRFDKDPGFDLVKEIYDLFRPGDWELMPCKIVETPQGLILFQDYQPGEDGELALQPLSMVLFPKAEEPGETGGQPIVIRAPEGAVLKFERSLSPFSSNVGELEHGQLNGEVQIYRLASGEGPDDSISVVTQNVQISPERIFSLYDVQFRFGKSQGRGRNLIVDLAGDRPRHAHGNFSGVERIELAQLHELYLHQESRTERAEAGDAADRSEDHLFGDSSRPIRITSQGPFVFDFVKRLATFERQVHVRFVDKSGDRMDCEKLSLWFRNEPKDGSPAKRPEGRFEIIRMAARGSPVNIHAESRETVVHSALVDYDLEKQKILLRDSGGAVLNRENQKIQSPDIVYHVTDDGRLGNAVLAGPGELLREATHDEEAFHCRWKNKLTIQPDDQRKVLSLDGAFISIGGKTTMSSERLHFWIWEIPESANNDSNPRWSFSPSKLFAEGGVTVRSPEIQAECEQAAAFWPEPMLNGVMRSFDDEHRLAQRWNTYFRGPPEQQRSPQSATANSSWHTASVTPQIRTGVRPQETARDQGQHGEDASRSLTKIRGREIQMQMRGGDDPSAIDEVTVDEQVHVIRQSTVPDGGASTDLEIHGHKLRIVRVTDDLSRLFINGNAQAPALISTGELDLYGPTIHLDQTVNRLWIEGAGQMVFSPTDPSDQSVTTALPAGTTTVNWSGGLIFDGQQIYFENAVQSESDRFDATDSTRTQTRTYSAALSLMLNQRVDFADSASNLDRSDLEIQTMVLVGHLQAGDVAFPKALMGDPQPLTIISQKQDGSGNLLSVQQIDARRAHFSAANGKADCKGPGSLTVRQNRHATDGAMGRALPVGHRTSNAKPIEFVQIDFEDSLTGNLESHEMSFFGNVHCFYDGVDGWNQVPDENGIYQADSTGMILDCDQLDLAQWQPRDAAEPIIEMIARGDARMRSNELDALAETITYYEATNRIKIDGGGRSFAELTYRKQGSRTKGHLTARTIVYNLRDGTYEVDGNQKAVLDIDRADR